MPQKGIHAVVVFAELLLLCIGPRRPKHKPRQVTLEDHKGNRRSNLERQSLNWQVTIVCQLTPDQYPRFEPGVVRRKQNPIECPAHLEGGSFPPDALLYH